MTQIVDLEINSLDTLTNYYQSEIIDKNLFIALNYLFNYTVTNYQKNYQVSSYSMRLHQLWARFILYYKRSGNKLTLHSLFNVLKLCKIKAYYVDKHDYTDRVVNKAYQDFIDKVFSSVKLIHKYKKKLMYN